MKAVRPTPLPACGRHFGTHLKATFADVGSSHVHSQRYHKLFFVNPCDHRRVQAVIRSGILAGTLAASLRDGSPNIGRERCDAAAKDAGPATGAALPHGAAAW